MTPAIRGDVESTTPLLSEAVWNLQPPPLEGVSNLQSPPLWPLTLILPPSPHDTLIGGGLKSTPPLRLLLAPLVIINERLPMNTWLTFAQLCWQDIGHLVASVCRCTTAAFSRCSLSPNTCPLPDQRLCLFVCNQGPFYDLLSCNGKSLLSPIPCTYPHSMAGWWRFPDVLHCQDGKADC